METSYYSTRTSFVIVFVTALFFFILHVNSYKGKKSLTFPRAIIKFDLKKKLFQLFGTCHLIHEIFLSSNKTQSAI